MLRPFAALHYDTQKVGDIDRLVTEPYDKISPDLKAKYLQSHPRNVVRLIRGESGPEDMTWHDEAARLWRAWRADGTITRDAAPSYGVLEQVFTGPDGRVRRRTSVVGAFDLAHRDRVFHHEKTHAKPKNDRLRLLEKTGVPFGLIFLLRHEGPRLDRSLLLGATPFGEATDGDGTKHRWSFVTDPRAIAALDRTFAESKYVIADGHHRFTVASEYADRKKDSAGAQYVLASVVEIDDPGLLILPTHRVIRGLLPERRLGLAPLLARLGARPFPTTKDPEDFLAATARAGQGTVGVMTSAGAFLWNLGPAGAKDDVGALDTYRLHQSFIDPLLAGLNVEETLSYRRSARAAVADVRERGADLAFILNGVEPDVVCAVASHGGVMPQKSTDFYPKMLDGFVFFDSNEAGLVPPLGR